MKKHLKALAALMLMTVVFFAAGCKPEDEPNNDGGNGTYNGHDYVDLGLPSGTLWATCNVGANSPGEYGDYFAWGETDPKTTYNWGTYKYCNGDYNQLTKYCDYAGYGYNGFTDDLTTLLPEDDAATANWGSDWCMPTADQWRELYQYTTQSWANGITGRVFTSTNGNTLFLPAAGYRWGDELDDAGSFGHYWSSSRGAGDTDLAWNFDFGSSGCYMASYDYRGRGRSVRPVCSAR